MKFQFKLAAIFIGAYFAGLAEPGIAQVRIEARHVVMLHPGFDTVWGTYMFGVRNEGTVPARMSGLLMLPKETIDFEAQEGLLQDEMVSGGEDGLKFDKEFPPGLTLISIGFKVSADFGNAKLIFVPKVDLEEISFVAKKDGLILSSASDLLSESASTMVSEEQFNAISAKSPIKAGESLIITVSNVPEGRGRLWWGGGIIAALLLTFSIGMTWKTMASSKPSSRIEVA